MTRNPLITDRRSPTRPADSGTGTWLTVHSFELLLGQLVAPGLPEAAEKSLMEHLVYSYGKTWHTWHTNPVAGQPGMSLPLGDPTLMWSFNRDGECDEDLRRERDETTGLDTDGKRTDRQSLLPLAQPERGVDAMAADFPNSTPIPGVVDAHPAS